MNVTTCTPLFVWTVYQNSFRVHGNTCHFNYEFMNGLNPAPAGTKFAENLPLPKQETRTPCIVISADTMTYRIAAMVIRTDGTMQIYGDGVEFQGIVIVNGSYEIA